MQAAILPGDSLWSLSRLFQVPLALVVDSNPNVDPGSIMIGQTIEIPGYISIPYRITPGETLWGIAASRGIPLQSLFRLNPSIQPASLYVGQIIHVPLRVTWPVVQIQEPYDYAAMMNDIRKLQSVYPFLRVRTIGSSVIGKEIPEVAVGTGTVRVHANASFHANEWITTPVLIQFLNEYALALTNNTGIRGLTMFPYYQRTSLSLVPMVNPDGVDLVLRGLPQQEPYRSQVLAINNQSQNFNGWKANIRGVDLNNQYPALWEREAARGPRTPAPRDYAGASPLTEPESQAIAQLTEERDFHRLLAFHTQGKVIFWGFEGLEPPESEPLVNEFARVSGYESVRYADSSAGLKDWFIQEWRRPGFTVEVGRGMNPLPFSQFGEIYQESLGILLATLYM